MHSHAPGRQWNVAQTSTAGVSRCPGCAHNDRSGGALQVRFAALEITRCDVDFPCVLQDVGISRTGRESFLDALFCAREIAGLV